ncbi:hypothetical protein G9A89_011625 [Geosiphon pyriformis]|nr:hypothetical protein G9A89_011625 [Geosiphon pyriformis]
MGLLFNSTPEIVICIILQKTSTNTNLKVAESENIGANYLKFAKSLFQHYCQHLGLNHNHISAELAFNFYVNKRIAYLLEIPVNIELTREAFYSELIQNTNLPTNYNFVSIIMEINKEIEHHIQQRYPITYMSKGKEKLQTPAKTRVEFPTNPSYHYTPGSTINITSTSAATSNITSAFRQFSFQSKQRKAELLEPYGTYFEEFNSQLLTPSGLQLPLPPPDFRISDSWKVIKSEEEEEKEAKDQEFTYQNPIAENPEFEILNLQTQQNLNPENLKIETPNIQTQDNQNLNLINQQNLSPVIIINQPPINPIAELLQLPFQLPPQQPV